MDTVPMTCLCCGLHLSHANPVIADQVGCPKCMGIMAQSAVAAA